MPRSRPTWQTRDGAEAARGRPETGRGRGKAAVMSYDEALGIWAEAAQDMSSAGLAQALGSTFNCADLCNQVAEKALQAVYVLTHDRRAPHAHNPRTPRA